MRFCERYRTRIQRNASRDDFRQVVRQVSRDALGLRSELALNYRSRATERYFAHHQLPQ